MEWSKPPPDRSALPPSNGAVAFCHDPIIGKTHAQRRLQNNATPHHTVLPDAISTRKAYLIVKVGKIVRGVKGTK